MSSMIYEVDIDGHVKDYDAEPINVNVQFGSKQVAIVKSGDAEYCDHEGFTCLKFSSNGEQNTHLKWKERCANYDDWSKYSNVTLIFTDKEEIKAVLKELQSLYDNWGIPISQLKEPIYKLAPAK